MARLIACIVHENKKDGEIYARMKLLEMNGNRHYVNVVAGVLPPTQVAGDAATINYLVQRYGEQISEAVDYALTHKIRCEDCFDHDFVGDGPPNDSYS